MRAAPFPRLTLLDTIGDSPMVNEAGDVRFTITHDGQRHDLRLDELPFPAATRPEAPSPNPRARAIVRTLAQT